MPPQGAASAANAALALALQAAAQAAAAAGQPVNNRLPLIPCPKGTAGRDYNLREKMGLLNDPALYCQIRVSGDQFTIQILDCTYFEVPGNQTAVRDYTKAVGIDWDQSWRNQDPCKISRMIRVVSGPLFICRYTGCARRCNGQPGDLPIAVNL